MIEAVRTPHNWRNQTEKYRLIGEECLRCHTKIFPIRDLCPTCGQDLGARSEVIAALHQPYPEKPQTKKT